MRYLLCLILISLAIDSSAQVFIPIAFWADKRGVLVISDGATYDYGIIAAGTPSDKVFTLTNTSFVPASSIAGAAFTGANPSEFTFKGGSFPGTGGDCTTSLVAYGSCTFVVTSHIATAFLHKRLHVR